ncbi:hypothetical protein AAY473_006395 [Plecturocebus cupreus]
MKSYHSLPSLLWALLGTPREWGEIESGREYSPSKATMERTSDLILTNPTMVKVEESQPESTTAV